MLKANELRIGNYIKFNNFLQAEEIVKINARFFSSLAGGRDMSEVKDDEEINNYYLGIPLTPEVLEKCGFDKKGGAWQHPTDNAGVLVSEHLFAIRAELRYEPLSLNLFKDGRFYVETYYAGIEVKSLHQLQNLYFALTGTELEYKP